MSYVWPKRLVKFTINYNKTQRRSMVESAVETVEGRG
jgi:hypothetical protein